MLRRFAILWLVPLLCGALALGTAAQEVPFTAQLEASQGGAARGRASFTFDTLGAQLTYRIVCDGLTAPPTGLLLSGPVGSNVSRAFDAHGNPIVGTASLSSSEADLLKSGQLFVDIRTASHPDGEIGGRLAPK